MINLTYILSAIIIVLIIGIIFICSSRSTFGSSLTSDSSTSIAPTLSNDSVLIFYAPWCGYCKDKMGEFKKAVTEGNGKIILIDTTNDSNKDIKEKYNITGFPTIIKGNGEKYSGERTADDIKKFAGLISEN